MKFPSFPLGLLTVPLVVSMMGIAAAITFNNLGYLLLGILGIAFTFWLAYKDGKALARDGIGGAMAI